VETHTTNKKLLVERLPSNLEDVDQKKMLLEARAYLWQSLAAGIERKERVRGWGRLTPQDEIYARVLNAQSDVCLICV
jgi:hypothetical protein